VPPDLVGFLLAHAASHLSTSDKLRPRKLLGGTFGKELYLARAGRHRRRVSPRPTNGSTNANATANAQAGYKSALDLHIAEGNRVWSRFNVMLTTSALVVSSEAVLLTRPEARAGFWILPVALPVFGVLLCILWFLLNARGFEWDRYFDRTARELEERYLSPVRTVSRMETFRKHGPVPFVFEGETAGSTKPYRMSVWARIPMEWIAVLVIGGFGVVHILMGVALAQPSSQPTDPTPAVTAPSVPASPNFSPSPRPNSLTP